MIHSSELNVNTFFKNLFLKFLCRFQSICDWIIILTWILKCVNPIFEINFAGESIKFICSFHSHEFVILYIWPTTSIFDQNSIGECLWCISSLLFTVLGHKKMMILIVSPFYYILYIIIVFIYRLHCCATGTHTLLILYRLHRWEQ